MLFVPISLVFINFLASFLIILTTSLRWDVDTQKFSFYSEPNSWYHFNYTDSNSITLQFQYHQSYFNISGATIKTIPELYVIAIYWVTATCLTLGFGDIVAQQPAEMFFLIFSIIAGYLFFTYVLVVISSSIANINSLLTTYQEHMTHFITYMNKEKVSPDLQA